MPNILEQKTTGKEDMAAGLRCFLEEMQLEERKDLEAKKKEKKKLLERAKTSLRTETEKMEWELALLEEKSVKLTGELARYKKEEKKKIQSLTLELNELKQDLDWKQAGTVKGEDVAKCLECPICLDLCKPPKEVSHFSARLYLTLSVLDLAV